MSNNLNISILNQNLVAIQGTQAKEVIFQVEALGDSGPFKTYVSLKDSNNNPINFNSVFDSYSLSTESNIVEGVAGPYEMNGSYATFQYGPTDGFSYSAGTVDTTSINSIIKETAIEGSYTIHLEILNSSLEIEQSTDVLFKIVSVETALSQYEQMLENISDSELNEIEQQYSELEILRQTVNAAILSLPQNDQATLIDRYYAAAENQYKAHKMILQYRSSSNTLEVAKVRNVGGNTPYSIIFKDEVEIGNASEAYLFYPQGYRAQQTNISSYPDDQPDDIKTILTPGQTNLVVSNTNVIGGDFLVVLKINEKWYKVTYTVNEAGTDVIAVNNIPINAPNNGDEWLSTLEAAMQNAITGTTMNMVISPETADLTETISASVTVNYPVFDAGVEDSILVDALITTNRSLPIGTTVNLSYNSTPVGVYTVRETEFKEFFLSDAFGLNRTSLNAHHSTDVWSITIDNLDAGDIDFTIKSLAAKDNNFNVLSSRYELASYTDSVKIIDRRAALDAVITGTTMGYNGDIIVTEGENISLDVTTVYPKFSVDLDPALAIDTLITLNKPLPVNANLEIFTNVSIGSYTEVSGTTQSLWLNDIINTANVRPDLADRNEKTINYTFVFSGLLDNDYTVTIKAIAALQNNFDAVDARYVLADVSIPIVVTDKSVLISKITEAEALLEAHQPGEDPGCAATVPRMNLQTVIDTVKQVKDDGDAERNDVLNSINDITNAIDTFKSFVVKWRINKAELQTSLDTAKDLLDSTTEGTQVGQSSAEAIADYQSEYNIALNVIETIVDFVDYFDQASFNAYQAQIDAAKEKLNAATVVFQDEIISSLDYATTKVTEYENAARLFFDSIRKKMRI